MQKSGDKKIAKEKIVELNPKLLFLFTSYLQGDEMKFLGQISRKLAISEPLDVRQIYPGNVDTYKSMPLCSLSLLVFLSR